MTESSYLSWDCGRQGTIPSCQLLQAGEIKNLRRQTTKRVAVEVKCVQRRQMSDLGRYDPNLVALQLEHLQISKAADLSGKASRNAVTSYAKKK